MKNIGQKVVVLWLSFCVFSDPIGFELTTPYFEKKQVYNFVIKMVYKHNIVS